MLFVLAILVRISGAVVTITTSSVSSVIESESYSDYPNFNKKLIDMNF